MSYRLLLPCFEVMNDARVERALHDLDAVRVRRGQSRWWVRDLAGEPEHNGDSRLVVHLHMRTEVVQESFDSYFYAPPGVQFWIEVRVRGATADREARLHARLVALTLAERLRLPALETRNGVYCRSPEALAAWCSREPHPETVLLAREEHMTAAPPHRLGVMRSPPPSAAGAVRESVPPPPPESALARWWHRVTKAKPYYISLPTNVASHVVLALVAEVGDTFHSHNVVHDAKHQRLVIYGKDSRATRDAVNYFRRRAHPERLRRVAPPKR